MALQVNRNCGYLISGYLDTRVETSKKSSVGSVSLNTSAMAEIAPHSQSVSSPYTDTMKMVKCIPHSSKEQQAHALFSVQHHDNTMFRHSSRLVKHVHKTSDNVDERLKP